MKLLKTALLVGLAFGTTGVALASKGGAGIYNTRHDFATRAVYIGMQNIPLKDQTGEGAGVANRAGQCSYCHTPHNAISTSLLWNKKVSANNFTWDVSNGSTTAGGTDFATLNTTYKGPSVKCLACHDGSVAIGDVKVFRGKEDININPFYVGQPKTGTTTEAAKPLFVIGSGGSLKGTHPIGMPYPYGRAANTYNSSTTGANVVFTEFVADPHQVTNTSKGGGQSASAEFPNAAGGDSQDAYIKLFNDNAGSITAGPATGRSGMECSTCHDPHNKQTADDWMLRGTANGTGLTGSEGYICVQCHIK